IVDDECATAECTNFVCSTCGNTLACPTGEACVSGWAVAGNHAPGVCAAGQHHRTSGEPCASDDDCASSTCAGLERKQCDDGRTCATAADCPFIPGDANGLKNGPCTTVGIQGGTCQ